MSNLSLRRALCAVTGLAALSASAGELPEWLPTIGGAMRAKYELNTEDGSARFQVRNARLRMTGSVGTNLGYFMQLDFCDKGTIKLLDAYATLKGGDVTFIAGQSRVPFSVDASRAPGNYLFVNRSAIGKYIGNQRSVGLKAAYKPSFPLYVEGGVFNSSAMSKTEIWLKHYTAGIKARYTFAGVLTPEVGFKTDVPTGGVRSNYLSTSMTLKSDRWLVEGEYMLRTYSKSLFDDCQGYNFQAQYTMPVKLGSFNRLSFEGRFDGMTAQSSGIPNLDGELTASEAGRERITLGTTLSYVRKKSHVDLRLNYEHYWYEAGATPATMNGPVNLAAAEVIVYF